MAVQTEHEPRMKDPSEVESPYNYQPTEEEEKAVKLGHRLLRIAKKARGNYDPRWLQYYRMFRGDQWQEKRPAYRASEVVNFIFQNIQSMSPLMTDGNPRVNFLPQEPSDREFAEIVDDLFVADWDKFNWLMEISEMILDGHIHGTGVGFVGFDPDALDQAGAANFESKDPLYCFPDPDAKDPDKATYFVYAEPRPVSWIKSRYPDKSEFIKPDCDNFVKQQKAVNNDTTLRHPLDGHIKVDWESKPTGAEKDDTALYIEIYMTPQFVKPDGCLDGESIKDENGEEVFKLKYPKGRKICMVGNVLLYDDRLPFDDLKVPFITWKNYVDPRSFWGISEVEQLSGPQQVFNKLVSFCIDVLVLMGNPIWVVGTDSGIDTDNLYNRPGMVVEKNPNSEVRREEGVQLQPYVLQLIDRFKTWFDDIGGSQDITRGTVGGGVSAASAIEQLQSAAQTRTRGKMRNLDATFEQFGSRYLSRVMQFYTAPRVGRITGKDGVQKYFKFEVNNNPDGRVARVSKYSHDKMMWEPSKDIAVNRQLDIKATTGSSLPFAKSQNEQRLFNLFDRGVIDADELLKGIDYPNAEAVINRMKQRQAEMAAQQPQGGQKNG